MLRPGRLEDAVIRQGTLLGLCPLLEDRLRRLRRALLDLTQRAAQRVEHDRLRALEPCLDIDRADERLVEARGETGTRAPAGLLFTTPEARELRQTELATDRGERGRRDEA